MPVDLLLDTDFDILIANGDLVAGESTRQHQSLLLLIEKGELREFPLRGVGVRSWLLDEQSGDLNAAIKREFEADGQRVLLVRTAANGNIQVEGVYD